MTDLTQFRSPQLLMVSGVGPADTLGQLGIPIVSESGGVGQGMWVCEIYGRILQLYYLFC